MGLSVRKRVFLEVGGEDLSHEELDEFNKAFCKAAPQDDNDPGALNITAQGIPVNTGNAVHGLQAELANATAAGLFSGKKVEKVEEAAVKREEDNIKKSRLEVCGAIALAGISCASTGGSALILGTVPTLLQGALSIWSACNSHNRIQKIQNQSAPSAP